MTSATCKSQACNPSAPAASPQFSTMKMCPQTVNFRNYVSTEVIAKCKVLELSREQLDQYICTLMDNLNRGLAAETHDSCAVKCFPTYVQDLPNGTETGKALALDLGGTNFRVLLVELGEEVKMESSIYSIAPELMTGSAEELFDFIAECLATFANEKGVAGDGLPLGFTFSFPLKQVGLTKGILEMWSKGFQVSGVVGQDVVELLDAAIARRDDLQISVTAILNDTTGTLMSCAWEHHNCAIGLIIGTGTNACYIEKQSNAELFDEPDKGSGEVLINTEWGAFGDDGALDFIKTEWDKRCDEKSINPGIHIHEKMISGMFLGELVRQVMLDCIAEGIMFGGFLTDELATYNSFKSMYVSDIESEPFGKFDIMRPILAELGYDNACTLDCNNVRYICKALSERAAYLVAAGLVTLMKKMEKPDITIGIDGTLYKKHPTFKNNILKMMEELGDPALKIREKCQELVLNNDVLRKCMEVLLDNLNRGLAKDTNSAAVVKCYPTYVQDLPNGTEKGKFLALDLGGTNFRVLMIELDGDKFEMKSKIFAIPENIMLGSGEALFDHIAECLSIFCKEENIINEVLPLGFTFSFPLEQRGLTSGILRGWTKGFKCSDSVGRDVVQMLNDAIDRRGDIKISVMAILNDSTGTLMSCAWLNRKCRVGVIVGTGSNACYVEKQKSAELFDEADMGSGEVLINTEWGAFGDDGSLEFVRTSYDREVDKHSINPGKQLHEKMLSGMYLGEIVRLAAEKFTKEGLLFGGVGSPMLFERGRFYTKYISEIESEDYFKYDNVRMVCEELGIKEASEQDFINLRYICECVSKRSAYLNAAALTTILHKMNNPSTTIGIDGSVYRYHPRYHNYLVDKMNELVKPGFSFDVMLSEDGSGRGAALVAAVAARKQAEKRS